MGDVLNHSRSLVEVFPVLGKVGATAWTLMTGPIGLVIGGVTALGALIYNNMGRAIEITTDLSNRFVSLYNKSRPVALITESLAAGFTAVKLSASAFFKTAGLGLKTIAQAGQLIKTGQFGLLDDLFKNAALRGKQIGKEYIDGIVAAAGQSNGRILTGLSEVLPEDVANTGFFKGIRNIGDAISGLWDQMEPSKGKAHLDDLSAAWKKATTAMAKDIKPPISKLEELRKKAIELDKLMKNQFLNGDLEGARQTAEQLDMVKSQLEELQNLQGKLTRDTKGASPLPTLSDDIKLVESLKSKMKDLGQVGGQVADEFIVDWKQIGLEIQEAFKNTFSEGLANGITSIFDGPDKEALASLNDELERNQAIRRDTSASKEERDAAAARTEIIEKEIEQEKARGNAVLQTAKLFLDAAKDIIKAKLAEAIATAIATSSSQGLLGLITAGVAIAGINALFNSKVPALAKGGVLDGPTLFLGGEYPGAMNNKEIVTPENLMRSIFQEVMMETDGNSMGTQQATSGAAVIKLNPIVETKIMDGNNVYAMIKLEHENELRTTGVNPFNN